MNQLRFSHSTPPQADKSSVKAMRCILAGVVVAVMMAVAAAATPALVEEDGFARLYGYVKLPPAYFSHTDSHNPINFIQPPTAFLTNERRTIRVPVEREGNFVAYHVPYGTYMLHVEYHDFTFPTVRVEVQYREIDGKRQNVFRAYENDFPVKPLEGTGLEEESPIVIPVAGMHSYFVPREQYSIVDLLKNPMILMMLVSFGMLGMLKLFPEEELKESRKMTEKWKQQMLAKAAGGSLPAVTTGAK